MTTTHRAGLGLVLALALATSAAPASGRPFDLNANGTEVPAGSPSMYTTATRPTPPVSLPATIVRVAAPTGFDWGDAGIGAAGGLALALVGLGGAFAISQSRARRTTAR